MAEGFIIMQIGNIDLDNVCDAVFVPAIEAAGLSARRVDRHNTGDLLKSEIVAFIERSDIIVADLTNERQNCYLEVGYAMGLGKYKNLILTAREDHFRGSANYKQGGPKVHFDLEGYDILYWEADKLDAFRIKLENRIKRRYAIVRPFDAHSPLPTPGRSPAAQSIDQDWLDAQRSRSKAGLTALGFEGFMEATVSFSPISDWQQTSLLQAVEDSNINTFGWPIGIVLNRDQYRPHPTSGGVLAEVAIAPGVGNSNERSSYDYWYLRRTGDFYMLRSLFEDSRREAEIFFDTRIMQITELLLFLARLYVRLDASPDSRLVVSVTHGGLKDRKLSSASQMHLYAGGSTVEDSVTTVLVSTLAELETNLVQNVKTLIVPLLMVFDFFVLGDEVYKDKIDRFVAGEVS